MHDFQQKKNFLFYSILSILFCTEKKELEQTAQKRPCGMSEK